MTNLPEPLMQLAAVLGKLPGIGPRSAERLALFLAQRDIEEVRQMATSIIAARERIATCKICGALCDGGNCSICSNPRRDSGLLCVVETAVDVLRIEKAGAFSGLYHVLGGRLSPLQGVEPEDLRISELEARLEGGKVREVVLALCSDVEGDATSYYLARRLAPRGVKITRIAHGLPAGSGLEFADELTLARALEGRREINNAT